MTDARIVRALSLILLGCMSNVIFLELIIKRDAGAGNLITLAQFAFVSAQGLPAHLEWRGGVLPRLKTRTIPLWVYALLTALYFTVSVTNNMALNFNISMPLHMVFRSSSLVASLTLGFLTFGKRYTPAQVVGVMLVSIGVIVTTLADSRMKLSPSCCGDSIPTSAPDGNTGSAEECTEIAELTDEETNAELKVWATGIAMLLFALTGSALLGQVQEWSYRKWTRNAAESKFYSHILALPFFAIFTSRDVMDRVTAWLETEKLADVVGVELIPDTLTALGVGDVPVLFVFLLGNVVTQLVCITGVYQLTAVGSTLTCTMAVTVRKFLSLVLSVWYFANPFSKIHWLGTVFVFLGVLQYADVLPFARVIGFGKKEPVARKTKEHSGKFKQTCASTVVKPKSQEYENVPTLKFRPQRKQANSWGKKIEKKCL